MTGSCPGFQDGFVGLEDQVVRGRISAPPAGADSGEIQIRLARDDWSSFDQAGDYSYDTGKTDFTESPRVTLYRKGKRVWGTEPSEAAPRPAGASRGSEADATVAPQSKAHE